ncbi:MAG: cell division protein FtsQ/DivIB [Methylococcales bacterium]
MSELSSDTGRCYQATARRDPVYLVIAFCLMLFAALLNFGLKPVQEKFFSVRYVRVHGAFKYLEMSELERVLNPLLEQGLVELDVDRIRLRTANIAWIKSVQIQRIWPDTLVIRGDEHVPFARFGETQLLSTEGVVFEPPGIDGFADLPRIEGPPNEAVALMEAFKELQISAQDAGMTLRKLEVSARDSWSLQVSDGLSIELGRQAPIEPFKRFVATLSLLGGNPIRSMLRVDLRYSNGYAVEWKTGSEPAWTSLDNENNARSKKAALRI